MDTTAFGFPFRVNDIGRVAAQGGDEAIQGRIIQVLFTVPGERVNLPDFGCGLFDLVFEPNSAVLGAATEFAVNRALTRWLADDIIVDGVQLAEGQDEQMLIEIAYTRKRDRTQQAVRLRFR